MSRFRLLLVIIILLVLVYFLTGGHTTNQNFFGGLDVWFKSVTGISITQVILAIWRLIVWIIQFVLKVLWNVIQAIRNTIK